MSASDARMAPGAQAGDVDRDGEIVDVLLVRVARLRRLANAIGLDRADDVDAVSQLRLTLSLLEGRP